MPLTQRGSNGEIGQRFILCSRPNSVCNQALCLVKGPPLSLKETNLFSVSAEFTLFPTAYTSESLFYGDRGIKRV
ncbi:unnamed protein product [Gulo gulo]|uniref:Uncharacterized protein n=1 Tax=Gulo gulo TaxID=48420 RepID=A0A9X9LGW7_GULGU|nr:unnamed protein product [Gulo gulo]